MHMIHVYIYMYMCMCMCISMYMYMYMYIKCSQLVNLYVYHSISRGFVEFSRGIRTVCRFDVRVTPSTAGTGSLVERWSLMARLGAVKKHGGASSYCINGH